MLRQTPLNAKHRELNAKLVDFSGWEMPIHYGSQIEEHHAVRTDAGMFDVSHMLPVDIKGDGRPPSAEQGPPPEMRPLGGMPGEPGRAPASPAGSHPAQGGSPAQPSGSPRPFLRQLLANNVDKLQSTGRALYTCMLHEGGGVIDDLIVYYMNESWFRLVVNAGCADKDVAWMEVQRDRLAPDLEIKPRHDLAMIALQGPNAAAKLWAAMPGTENLTKPLKPFNAVLVGEMFIARTGYTGEDGFEVMLPAKAAPFFWQALLQAGVKPCGLGARDTLRLEAGMNLYGQDMDASTTPFVSGLGWTVDLQGERDFIGKDALLRLPRDRQLVGLLLLDKGVLRAHQKVHTARGEGEITSGSYAPTLNASIALARVPAGVAVGDEVEVEIRDRRMKARVVKYPFVRNGKVLVQGEQV